MLTVRRTLRTVAKPAAFVAVAMLMSLSLIVTTPSNAHALVKYPKQTVWTKFLSAANGAIKTVGPVAMGAISLTPAGWGLRAVQLGLLAYETSDIWMPYVTGTFGQTNPDKPADGTMNVLPTFHISGLSTGRDSRSLTVSWTYNGTNSTNKTGYMSTDFTCKQVASGNTSHPVGEVFSNAQNTAFSFTLNTSTKSGSVIGNMCPLGSDIVSGTVKGQPTAPGPDNSWSWGDAGFDPHSPDVGYQGKSECIDSAGNISWVVGPIIPGDNGAMLMPSCAAAGKGHGTGRTQVTAFKPDGTTETVWDTGANPLTDPATPLCDPGRTSSGCEMQILKDDQPCTVGDVECENWSEQAQKDPTRYKCKFGPYTLPLSSCNLIEGAYITGGSPLNDSNTDGNPATRSNLGPDGAAAPAPAPAVTGTGTGTGTLTTPGTAGQPGPGSDPASKNCYPTGWAAFNPVEWVMKPVGCALEAAFVPKTQTVQTQTTRIQNKINTVGFSSITAAWMGTFEQVGGGSGCAGPTVDFNFGGVDQTLQPFNACSQPMSTVAAITYAFSCIVIVLAGGLGIGRAISSGFGFNFTLGRGSSD